MSTSVAVPCIERLTTLKKCNTYLKEAKFENDLRVLVTQLMTKLHKNKKMIKKMKKLSKQGKEELKLTSWIFESRSPLYSYDSVSQKWMLFRACWDLWKILQTLYGKGFNFRIKSNTNIFSRIKQNLFINWNIETVKSVPLQLNQFERPAFLDYDPRDSYNASLLATQQKRQPQLPPQTQSSSSSNQSNKSDLKKEYGHLPGEMRSPEPSELGDVYPARAEDDLSSDSSYLDA